MNSISPSPLFCYDLLARYTILEDSMLFFFYDFGKGEIYHCFHKRTFPTHKLRQSTENPYVTLLLMFTRNWFLKTTSLFDCLFVQGFLIELVRSSVARVCPRVSSTTLELSKRFK